MPLLTTRRALLLIPLCLVLLAGCASNKGQFQKLSKYPPSELYDRGRRALRAHDFTSAVDNYEALTARYPFTPEARQARLDVIYAYYKLDEKESARDAADTFIKENPQHPHIDYAYYLRGLVDFERTPYKIELWLGGDPNARPPQTARDAIDALRTVVTKYPTSIYATDARAAWSTCATAWRISSCGSRTTTWNAVHGWRAHSAPRQAIEQYDGAPATKDALRIMIVCYRELNYEDLADNAIKVFQQNFPGESYEFKSQDGFFRALLRSPAAAGR
ncbi:MAG: outer membrane protein assembly factor BamD [Pseudomonadota bacterium]